MGLEAASCPLRAMDLWLRPTLLSQLLAMGSYLGVHALDEPHNMWVAHLALCLPLPAAWATHVELSSGRSYYHNALLGLTQWELPQWSYCRGLLAALRSASYPPTDPTQPYTPLQQRLQSLRDAMMRRSRVCNYVTALSGAKRFSASADTAGDSKRTSRERRAYAAH